MRDHRRDIGPPDSAAQPIFDRVSASPEQSSTPAALELHIEELVLDGFAPADRFGIGDAVERELTRLIARRGLPELVRNPVDIERLDGGTFKVAPGTKPQALGVQLAQRLHQRLSPIQKAPLPQKRSKETQAKR